MHQKSKYYPKCIFQYIVVSINQYEKMYDLRIIEPPEVVEGKGCVLRSLRIPS